MPRRGNVPKREILPDPVYGSVLVTRLINSGLPSWQEGRGPEGCLLYTSGTLDTQGVSGRMQARSKYGAKRPKQK